MSTDLEDQADDGNISVASSSSAGSTDVGSSSHFNQSEDGSRNERREIEKLSSKETGRVRLWRVFVTLALAATGVTVTLVTYRRLVEQEQTNFQTAVSANFDLMGARRDLSL